MTPLPLDCLEQRLERRPLSTNTAVPPGSSASRKAFESQDSCMLRSTIIGRILRAGVRLG